MQLFAKLGNCWLGMSWEIYPRATLPISANWQRPLHSLFRYLKSTRGPKIMCDASKARDQPSSKTPERHHIEHHIEEFLITHIKHYLFCLKKIQLCY